jgi:hypothetical protein
MVLRGAPGKTGRTILALTACVSATLSSVPADAEPPNVYELVAQAGALAANSMVALTQQLVAAQNAANQAQAAALQAFAALGSFRTTFYGPTALAVAEAGLQLYEASGNEVRAEYKLIAGDNFLSQTASLRLAYHF